jgi:hypothetical protein
MTLTCPDIVTLLPCLQHVTRLQPVQIIRPKPNPLQLTHAEPQMLNDIPHLRPLNSIQNHVEPPTPFKFKFKFKFKLKFALVQRQSLLC